MAGEVDPRLATFIVLAAATGARRSELHGLRWRDVNLASGVVEFRRGIVMGPDGIVEKDTKTHSCRCAKRAAGSAIPAAGTSDNDYVCQRMFRARRPQNLSGAGVIAPVSDQMAAAAGRPRWRRRTVAAAIVLLALLGLSAGLALFNARQHLTRAKADLEVVRKAIVADDSEAAGRALDRASDHVAAARSRATTFPLATLQPLPLLGSPASALLGVTRAAHEVVAAARIVVDARASFPISATSTLRGQDLSGFHAASADSSAKLDTARRRLSAARAAVKGPTGAMLPPVSALAKKVLVQIDGARRQIDGTLRGLAVVGHLTSPTADLRLLVLSQDSLELRPTGGYIGSYGVLHFSLGTARLEQYEATDLLPKPQPDVAAPPDLAPWLPREWRLSNVNWWPNFPTTAIAARDMFKRHGGGDVDGVVAITEHAVARLVGALGPLQVPGYDEPVVEEGFARRALYEVELKQPLDEPRKRFLTELSKLLFARLFDLREGQLPAVARAVDRSVGAGDIQVWFSDPALQRLVAPTAWSGQLPPPRRDFLMLVDANLSGSKANLDLVKKATYQVRRRDDGWLRARLEVTVQNEGEEHPDLNPYYNGFLRIYLPRKARVADLNSGQRRERRAPDAAYQVVSQELDVARHAQQRVALEYWLPPSTAPGGKYQLTWMRQAGTPRDTLTVTVGDRTVRANPIDRSLEVSADFRRHPVLEFIRDRWIVKKLGGLAHHSGMDLAVAMR